MKIKAAVEVQCSRYVCDNVCVVTIFSTSLICSLIRPVCYKEKSHANQKKAKHGHA